LCTGNRFYGHALIGEQAVACAPFDKGVHYNLLLAISSVGVVGYFLSQGTTSGTDYINFIRDCVCPHFPSDRFLWVMMDNASIHVSAEALVRMLGNAGGHRPLFRPVCSPDLAPIEGVNGEIKQFLRNHRSLITPDTLHQAVRTALESIPSSHFTHFFAHCGYR